MSSSIQNIGPFTPGHCPICGAVVPRVEDPSYSVRKWARYLNYMNHLKKYHREFYKWNKLWGNLRMVGIPPSVVVAFLGTYQWNPWLFVAAFILLVAPLPGLYVWRWKRIREFQDDWNEKGETGEPTTSK